MDLGISGRVAWVTGAGRGLGRVIAETLAAEGAHVVAMSRTASELKAVVAGIQATGGSAEARTLDLTDGATLREGLAPPAILVHNANENLPDYREFGDITPEEWLDVMARNHVAMGHVVRAALPGMKEAGWGRIVLIGSLSAILGGAKQVPYATHKASMDGFARSLALEVSPGGVTVNVVHPGLVMTERSAARIKDRARKWIELKTATRRLTTPQEVADLVTFLASDRAGNMTGASIPLGGGVELGFSL